MLTVALLSVVASRHMSPRKLNMLKAFLYVGRVKIACFLCTEPQRKSAQPTGQLHCYFSPAELKWPRNASMWV